MVDFSGYSLVDESKESVLLGLFASSSYQDALIELNSWPEGIARSWYEGTCYFHLEDYLRSGEIYGRLNRIQGFPVEVPLRLAVSLHCQDRLVEALSVLLSVFANGDCWSDEDAATALIQYGNICLEMGLAGHLKTVFSNFNYLLDISPELKTLDGISALFVADYLRGWEAYEARLQVSWGNLPVVPAPLLTSDSIAECRHLALFVEPSQGFGDVFWGLRCVPLFKSLGIDVSLVCAKPLAAFMRATNLFVKVAISFEELSADVTHSLPMMSFPHLLKLRDPGEFPSPEVSLVFANERLLIPGCRDFPVNQASSQPIVALNWQGNRAQEGPRSAGIRGRSFSLEDFERVYALRRCSLISVQVGDASSEIKMSSLRRFFDSAQFDLDRPGRDFLVTADALLQSDLLITNDTSVAHLGGLLNIPTWVVLKCFPYWQWGDQGQHNVWYPSIRCFRQHRPGDWESAMGDVNEALMSLLQGRRLHQETQESPGL